MQLSTLTNDITGNNQPNIALSDGLMKCFSNIECFVNGTKMSTTGDFTQLLDICHADGFDEFCAKRFIIGDEAEVEDEMARYRDEMGVDHFLVRLQWPGFEQKGVVDAVERIGRVAARLG